MKKQNSEARVPAAEPELKLAADLLRRVDQSLPKNPAIGSLPLKPASHFQDSGGGYNNDFVFPQK